MKQKQSKLPYIILALAVVFLLAAQNLWLLRWGAGALIGIWELLRIRRRKVVI